MTMSDNTRVTWEVFLLFAHGQESNINATSRVHPLRMVLPINMLATRTLCTTGQIICKRHVRLLTRACMCVTETHMFNIINNILNILQSTIQIYFNTDINVARIVLTLTSLKC